MGVICSTAMHTGCGNGNGLVKAYELKSIVAKTKRLPIKIFNLFISNASAGYVTIL